MVIILLMVVSMKQTIALIRSVCSGGTNAITLTEAIGEATGTATGTSIGTDTFSDIETFIGTDGDDVMIGNASSRTYRGGDGDDFFAPASNDTIIGGEGSDTVSYATSLEQGTIIDLNIITAQTGEGAANGDTFIGENVVSSLFVNNVTGNAQDNVLTGGLSRYGNGGGGNDTLNGGNADDTLDGGEGADEFSATTMTPLHI